jgi:hypothetical protein
MKAFLFFTFFISWFASSNEKKADKKPFTLTLIGYVSVRPGFFSPGDGCAVSSCATAVYSNARSFGQTAIGDQLLNSDGTPFAASFQAYGYSKTLNGAATRGLKMDGSGFITGVQHCTRVAQWYQNGLGANCAGTGFSTTVYGGADDPDLYPGKVLYNLQGGQLLPNGSYTITYKLNGSQSIATFDVAGGLGSISNLAFCYTNPIPNAGADQTASMPSPTITLVATGFDPDGTITGYHWDQISGPNTATIVSANTAATNITGVIVGTYVFRVTATDNSAATGTDDVQVQVMSAPLCATASLIPIQPLNCFGLSGQMLEGVKGMPDRLFGNAYVYADGPVDPKNGVTDFDPVAPGVQGDPTSGMIGIPVHNYFKLGRDQMAVLFKLDQVYNIEELWTYFRLDDSRKTGAAVHVFAGDRLRIKAALRQFMDGNITPDAIINAQAATGWYNIANLRLTGQYILLLYNPYDFGFGKINADFSTWKFYGCAKTPSEHDNIGPYWDFSYTRDAIPVTEKSKGLNVATPLPTTPNYWANNLSGFDSRRGYVSLSSPSNLGGAMDKYTGPWIDEATTPNAIDLSPWADAANSPFIEAKAFHDAGRMDLISVRSPNGRVYQQTGVNEYLPVDDASSDKRLFTSWERWKYFWKCFVYKFGPPPVSYSFARFEDDPFVGQQGMGIYEYVEVGNEWNSGFRATNDQQYADPWVMMVMMYETYNAIKSVSPNTKVVIGGFAAWDVERYWAMNMLAEINFGQPTRLYDVANMHTIITLKQQLSNEGYIGGVGNNGALPGLRGENRKLNGFIDTLTKVSGYYSPLWITEYSYTANPKGPQSNTGNEVFVSQIGAPTYPQHTYSIYENQAIAMHQADEVYSSIPGLTKTFVYEYGDATDTTGCTCFVAPCSCGPVGCQYYCYDRNDASNGITFINNTPKPTYYILNGKNLRLRGWAVANVLSDSLQGRWETERRKVGSTDSACKFTMWQDTLDAPGPRVLQFPLGVTSVRRYRPGLHDLNGTDEILTLNAQSQLIWQPDQLGDYFFYTLPSGFLNDRFIHRARQLRLIN